MAVTQNTYTGDGSTVLFSFTFPYLETTDIKVSLNGNTTTAYTLANATTIQFNTAPSNGDAIRIYRDTDDSQLNATFYPGSAIRSSDLNDNFTQNLYVTQEANNYSVEAIVTAEGAVTTANAATATANGAVSTANAATATANGAVTTANAASTAASNAVTTANAATTTAGNAVTTANTALTTANSAAAAVANSILYDVVANVAAIPASPGNNDAVEVVDSTGIESFTPLSGVPAGYVGDSGLSARIVYNSASSTWIWIQYFPNDPENRYGDSITTLQGDVTTLQTDLGTAQSDILGLDSAKLDATTAASTYLTQANATSTYLDISTASSTYQTQAAMSSYSTTAQADAAYEAQYTVTTTATSKTLVNRERCTVTAATQTLTLPATPSAGDEVTITIDGAITDTVIARNGSNIMSLAQDMTIDKADVSVTLYYVDATRGWRVI